MSAVQAQVLVGEPVTEVTQHLVCSRVKQVKITMYNLDVII